MAIPIQIPTRIDNGFYLWDFEESSPVGVVSTMKEGIGIDSIEQYDFSSNLYQPFAGYGFKFAGLCIPSFEFTARDIIEGYLDGVISNLNDQVQQIIDLFGQTGSITVMDVPSNTDDIEAYSAGSLYILDQKSTFSSVWTSNGIVTSSL